MSEPLHVYVKRLRQAQGAWFSQNELARRAGISPSTVNRLERGRTSEVKTLRAIAPHLGVEAEDLLRRAGQRDVEDHEPLTEPTPDVGAVVAQILTQAGYADEDRAIILAAVRRLAPVRASNSVSS